MPVYLDVKSRLDVAAAQLAAREAVRLFTRAGDDIGRGLGANLSKAFAALDSGAARDSMLAMQAEMRRTADVEVESAARMTRAMGQVEIAQRRLAEMSARYGDTSSKAMAANVALADSHARAAKAQRDHVDAMVGSEAAAARLAGSTKGAADEVSRAGQVFNAVGIASVAGLGAAMVETTKKAGDFEASQTRLVASAGETAQNLKTVSDGILQLAGQVGYSAQEMSNAMYGVEKAGFRGADGVTIMRSAAQGAKSENAELKEVLGGLTTSMNDFHFSADQSADVMSKMVEATALARTNFQEFSGALHTTEPLFSNIGKSQGLDNGQMQKLMADLYGVTAQMTRSGDSADHASELIAHAEQKLLGPTAGMRDMMGALGLDAQDVTDHLGERGLAGTLQLLQQAVQAHTKDGKVNLDVHMQSAQLARAETEAFNGLTPAARNVAQQIKDGTLSYQAFRKSRGGLSVEQANEVGQWNALNNKLTGFSSLIKWGIGDNISYDQALKILTGDQSTLAVMLQTTGQNAKDTNDKIQQIDSTTRNADGTVKGFNETQQTLNAKMADAKAAFGAAAIEMGNAFIPVAIDVANIAKGIGDTFAKHPGIMHAVVDALGVLGGAWLGFKALNIAEAVLAPIARGLGGIIAGEEGAEAGATRLSGALSRIGRAGGLAAGAQVLGGLAEDNTHGTAQNVIGVGTDVATGAALGSMFGPWGAGIGAAGGLGYGLWDKYFSHAEGGPLNAPGPKGKDSALFWGAAGEHVLTADDVDAMGGHGAVHAFRNALHRQGGGAIGGAEGLYAEAQALNGGRYVWGSTDCSGAVSLLVDAAVGGSGRMNTGNAASWLAARGFQPGFQSGALNIGWYNGGPGGGHMAATLPDGTHFESGGQHGGIMLGGSAAGAETSEFTNHMYLPVEGLYPDGPGGGGGGFGGGGLGGMFGGFGGGGGMPAGATPGTGPGGQPGYYTAANPAKVAHAQEEVTHLQEEIKNLEERKKDMKSTATQAEKDRLEEQLRHEHVLLDEANARLAKAQQGDFHAGRGGRGGGMGGMQFGTPLPANFGLNKGLGGLAEWVVDFLGDMMIAPIEGAMMNAAMGGGSPGGYADLGDIGTQFGGGAPNFGGGGPAMAVGAFGPAGGGGSAGSGGGSPSALASQAWANDAAAGASGSPAKSGMVFDPTKFGRGAPLGQSFDPTKFGAAPGTSNVLLPGIGGIPGVRGNPQAHWHEGVQSPDAFTPSGGLAQTPQFRPGGSSMADLNAWVAAHPGLPRGPGDPGFVQRVLPPEPIFTPRIVPGVPDPSVASLFSDAPGFSTGGGPQGTDTIPAWLTPGEEVLPVDQAEAWRHAQHFAGGTGGAGVTDVGAVAPTPPPPMPAPKPAAPQGESPTGSGKTDDDKPQLPGGGVGGTSTQSSKGLGIQGGALGAAEGAAAAGADMFAPGSGAAVQIASQLMNRTIAYAGQMAGIGVQGLLSTFLPSDSPLSDFGNTLPGRLLSGIAGAKPAAPQSAGNTQAPLKQGIGSGQGESVHTGDQVGMQLNGPMTVQANNVDQFKYQMAQTQQQYNMTRLQVPANNPGRG